MRVNGNAAVSLPFDYLILTTISITRGAVSCTGSGTKPTTPTVVGVYIGMGSSAAGGIEICASSIQYIDSTIINSEFQRMMSYIVSDASFN